MKIENVAMYVDDLIGAREFFVKYFGAKSNTGYYNKNADFKSYFLTFDNGSRLEIMSRPEMKNTEKSLIQTGFIHIAFSVGAKEIDC